MTAIIAVLATIAFVNGAAAAEPAQECDRAGFAHSRAERSNPRRQRD